MATKAFVCSLELTIHGLSSPGAQISTKGDLYVGITLFDKRRRTSFCDVHFPLCFHERIVFEKTFLSAKDPLEILDRLEDEDILIELIQLSAVSDRDHLLAVYTGDARSFFYPHPSLSPKLTQNRELIMDRTSLFPGVAPKLEFSTYTAIREVSLSSSEAERELEIETSSARRSKQLSKRGSSKKLSDLDRMVNEQLRLNTDKIVIDNRPAFVVRHLDPILTSRPPGLEPLGYAIEARKREDVFRKKPSKKTKSARSRRSKDEDDESGPADYLHGYHHDYKYRTKVDGLGDWYPYQATSSCCADDKVSGRQYCTVCNLYKRYTGQTYRSHTFRDHVPSFKELSERERESARLRRSVSRSLRERERRSKQSDDSASDSDNERPLRSSRSRSARGNCALCRAISASARHGSRSPTDEISEKVHKALWRDRAYEERLANLVTKYDSERRAGNSLDKLERDLYLADR